MDVEEDGEAAIVATVAVVLVVRGGGQCNVTLWLCSCRDAGYVSH